MKLTIFQSDKGDCLLLSSTGADGQPTHILVDGGMSASYREHAARAIAKLPQVDLVYVSHIDQDHISGVLRLIDDAFDWRVFRLREQRGETAPRPKVPEPPPIHRIWHNAFHDQVSANAGAIEDLLVATANLASAREDLREAALENSELATSIPEAIALSQRIGGKQLGIQINQGRGKLLMARKGQKSIRLGGIALTIIGPFPNELSDLRKEWNAWLKTQKGIRALQKIRGKAAADAKEIAASSVEDFIEELELQAAKLGDRKNVTAPNLASLMLLAEENGRTLLLTGDGHWQTILDGLEASGRVAKGAPLHVNVLKVQHHGSEHNIHKDFCDRITADHYVFCGNGAHQNPDLEVVQLIFDSRIGANRAPAAPNRKFKFWFNSHSSVTAPKNQPHMKKLEALAAKLVDASGGKLRTEFLEGSAFRPLAV